MKKFRDFIEEMAHNIGDASYSRLNLEPKFRESKYETNSKFEHHSYPLPEDNSVALTKRVEGKNTTYSTNDNDKKEVLHYSNIKHNGPTESLPFENEEQHIVERVKGGKLPPEYATNMIYDHFKQSNIPLRSSDAQYRHGHNMWRKLTHKALSDGHHVYYHDGKTLHKVTKQNIDDSLDSSFGKTEVKFRKELTPKYEDRHIILSKKEL